MSTRAIGIDLGTTNCALAWIDADEQNRPNSHCLEVAQLVEIGEVDSLPLLPSFAYLPAAGELPEDSRRLPWSTGDGPIVGELARKLGSRVPGRLIASAKSWLCHPGVDRRARILPWQTEADVEPLSPVEASSLYLSHLVHAWNHRGQGRIEEQSIVLTIPASFDDVARELTVEAARQAGLENVTLLEEPQAAFYQWMAENEERSLAAGTTCLVVDCGGGTTDFSLLAVDEVEGQPAYRRIAVGEHLLLGGDNIDLAIARHIEQFLSPGRRLDLNQWWHLVLDSRRIKETMLGADAPASMPATILGRGRRIVGDVVRGEVSQADVLGIALDGFFPIVGPEEFPETTSRSGLREFGLPYVSDPAISKHLAKFLHQHRQQILEFRGRPGPDAVLFNGGLFNAALCRQRIMSLLQSWFGNNGEIQELATSSVDLAVARGAAEFGQRRRSGGVRIQAGTARSYYVGLSHSGGEGRRSVLCVMPQGVGEDVVVRIDEPTLELQLGEPVAFALMTSTIRPNDRAGQVLELAKGQLAELPPISTILRGGKRAGKRKIAVRIEARLTEIGILELYCASLDGNGRWKLQFQAGAMGHWREEVPEKTESTLGEVWSEEQLESARTLVAEVFSYQPPHDARRAVEMPKRLEQALGMKRDDWPTPVLRAMGDELLDRAAGRASSADHEARWYNLTGFCLRPGFGDIVDSYRVERLWKLVHAGPTDAKSDRSWTESWIMWRRVAGGLDPNRQSELAKRLLPFLPLGAGRKPPRRIGSHELAEMWRTMVSLEHLALPQKIELGRRLLIEAAQEPRPVYVYWSLARLGLRSPIYAPANMAVPTREVESWVERLLELAAPEGPARTERNFALYQMARLSGDRGRDLDPDLRGRILDVFQKDQAPEGWRESLNQVVELDVEARNRILGDALPLGLSLITGGD